MSDLNELGSCESCICFKELNQINGKCRTSPPVLVGNGTRGTGAEQWVQPIVGHDGWCGEYFDKNAEALVDADFMEVVEGGDVKTENADPVDTLPKKTEDEKLAEMMGESPAVAPAAAKTSVKKKAAVKK